MAITLARLQIEVPDIDLLPLAPEIGQEIEFVDNTGAAFDQLTAFGESMGGVARSINLLRVALGVVADRAGLPKVVDVQGAARGSADYATALDQVPITDLDVAIARKLLVTGIAPDGDEPLSDWRIAQEGRSGPEWSRRLRLGA